jgi:hypothetical protein
LIDIYNNADQKVQFFTYIIIPGQHYIDNPASTSVFNKTYRAVMTKIYVGTASQNLKISDQHHERVAAVVQWLGCLASGQMWSELSESIRFRVDVIPSELHHLDLPMEADHQKAFSPGRPIYSRICLF